MLQPFRQSYRPNDSQQRHIARGWYQLRHFYTHLPFQYLIELKKNDSS